MRLIALPLWIINSIPRIIFAPDMNSDDVFVFPHESVHGHEMYGHQKRPREVVGNLVCEQFLRYDHNYAAFS